MTTIPSKLVDDLFYVDVDGVVDDWTRRADQRISTGRWRERRRLVIEDPNSDLWGIDYSQALTENQDHVRPWEDSDKVTAVRVYPHAVTETVYRTEPVPPTALTADECARIHATVAGHARRELIETIAEATYDLDGEDGGGSGMVWHLAQAHALVSVLPGLRYEEQP